MAITRDQLEATLAVHDADALRLILHASDVDPRGAETPAALAARIADAIWWNYCTPLGYITERTSFEDIVRHLARKLQVSDRVDPDVPVWDQVSALTQALVAQLPPEGISIESLDEGTRARLFPSWTAPLGWGSGATSSFATRWGTGKVLALLKTPIGRLLPLLPVVGPWIGAVRAGISTVYFVTGPLGVALAVLSVNSALGTNYTRLVPLVLGVGALGPQAVMDAEIVRGEAAPAPVTTAPVTPVASAAPVTSAAPMPSTGSMSSVVASAALASAVVETDPEPTSEVDEPLSEDAYVHVVPAEMLSTEPVAPSRVNDTEETVVRGEELVEDDAVVDLEEEADLDAPDLTEDVPDMS
jgi:hypothetical protein